MLVSQPIRNIYRLLIEQQFIALLSAAPTPHLKCYRGLVVCHAIQSFVLDVLSSMLLVPAQGVTKKR